MQVWTALKGKDLKCKDYMKEKSKKQRKKEPLCSNSPPKSVERTSMK